MGLIITFVLGIFILLGAFIVKLGKNTKEIELFSISIALGTMLFLVFLDLIPEINESMNNVNIFIILLLVLIGLVSLKLLDLFIPEHDHEMSIDHNCTKENVIHIGIISLVAIFLHNLIEGMAVYELTNESIKLGVLASISIGLHNIPMGMIIYTTLEKKSKKSLLTGLFLAFISTFIGGFVMFLIHDSLNDYVIGSLICVTLGMLLYIIIFELIPHIIHSKNKKLSIFGFLIGIILLLFASLLE